MLSQQLELLKQGPAFHGTSLAVWKEARQAARMEARFSIRPCLCPAGVTRWLPVRTRAALESRRMFVGIPDG